MSYFDFVVAFFDTAVLFDDLRDGQVRGVLAVGGAVGFPKDDVLPLKELFEFMAEAGLADTRFTDK